jgi:hypothetical protein
MTTIKLIEDLLLRIPDNQIALAALIVLTINQFLKWCLYESGFSTNSLGRSFCIIGGEFSIVSLSIILSSARAKCGVLFSTPNHDFGAAVLIISIVLLGGFSVTLTIKAYRQNNLPRFLFFLKKFCLTSAALISGLGSLGITLYYC